MRYFLLSIFLLVSIAPIRAQSDFEGVITYKIRIEGSFAGLVRNLLPTDQVIKVRNTGYSRKLTGGSEPQLFIYQHKDKNTYQINDNAKVASRFPSSKAKATITKTNEEAEIIGYICQKYKVEIPVTGSSASVVQYVWASPKIKSSIQKEMNDSFLGSYMGIDGFPLKVVTQLSMMGAEVEMVYTAISLAKEKVNAKELEIPAGYKVQDFQVPELNSDNTLK